MLKVCALVCVYNGADTIGRCIESLLEQDYPKEFYEIIVVENGSTDKTTEIVEQYPVRLFHSPVRGLSPARNYGIAQTDADVIVFTDADCIAVPNWVSDLAKPFEDPKVGGVGGPIRDYVHPDRSFEEMFAEECKPLVTYISGENEFLPHLTGANCSYRRSMLNQIGNFNARLPTGEDIDIAWRIQLEAGGKIVYAPDAIIYHHHRSSREGLARQYRQYGFGEIMLDTIFGKYPGYPRTLGFQVRRILGQTAALPRYAVSTVIRQIRYKRGKATEYQAVAPRLWFLIESNNVRGKIEGILATRFMRDAQGILKKDPTEYVDRFFQAQKE
jgi:glycosyltransferase involved in cell wall biosynthesis